MPKKSYLYKQFESPVTKGTWVFFSFVTLCLIILMSYASTLMSSKISELLMLLTANGYFEIPLDNMANIYQLLLQPVVAYYFVKSLSGGFTIFVLNIVELLHGTYWYLGTVYYYRAVAWFLLQYLPYIP